MNVKQNINAAPTNSGTLKRLSQQTVRLFAVTVLAAFVVIPASAYAQRSGNDAQRSESDDAARDLLKQRETLKNLERLSQFELAERAKKLADMEHEMQFVLLAKSDYALATGAGTGKAMLGVHVRKTDETLRSQLGLDGKFGLVVEHVTVGSGAEAAELQVHDVLLKLDNQVLVNVEQFQSLIESKDPGDEVELKFYRNGRAEEIQVKLSERKAIAASDAILELEKYHDSMLQSDDFMSGDGMLKFHDCKACHTTVDSHTILEVENKLRARDSELNRANRDKMIRD